ncbi:MAG: tetratricopeptide repeat protein [Alphaproteobacteria bacterium]
MMRLRLTLLALSLAMAAACSTATRAQSPSNATVKDALAAERRGDIDMAVRLYTRALDGGGLTVAVTTVAHNNRGVLYRRKGRFDEALADFGAAIRLEPQEPAFYNSRGNVYLDGGQAEAALPDYDNAIRLDAGYGDAYANRARANFMLAQFAAAASDYQRSLSLKASQPAVALWLHVARGRAGERDAEALERYAAAMNIKTWPAPIVAFFLGRLSAEQLAAAGKTGDTETQYRHTCSTLFFLGEDALLRGNTDRAEGLLQKASELCRVSEPEHSAAKAELGHLRPVARGAAAASAAPSKATLAPPDLQLAVTRVMVVADYGVAKACNQRKILSTAVLAQQPDGTSWTERWTLDRCGKPVSYRVSYSPGQAGATQFAVRLEE